MINRVEFTPLPLSEKPILYPFFLKNSCKSDKTVYTSFWTYRNIALYEDESLLYTAESKKKTRRRRVIMRD